MAYRVLHCLASMNRGGAETFIMNMFRVIDKEKIKFDFLLNTDEGAYINEIKFLGGNVYVVPPRSLNIISYCRSINIFFKKHKDEFDAVHIHTSSLSSLEILYYAKKMRVSRRVIHSHNTVQKGIIHNGLHWINKLILKYVANTYLACSKVAADWLYEYTGVYEKSIIVNNGIDVEVFSFNEMSRKEIRVSLGIDKQAIVIGHVGRFDEVKNHTFLLKIFKEYFKLNNNSFLVMVGIGPLKADCEKEAEDLGLLQNVRFTGLKSDIYRYLSAFDYFVFPSLYEGLPVALVEAQTSGLTVVCSDKVSKEARLSEGLTYFPLNKTPFQWAEYIYNLKRVQRIDAKKQVVENGYAIQSTVLFLISNVYK